MHRRALTLLPPPESNPSSRVHSVAVPAQRVGPHRSVPLPGHHSDPRQGEVHDTDRLPPTEKIMEAATGDKDFWIVDVVGNFCFVHPAKAGISSNLNLITDKGNIYSFTLQDVSATMRTPDLKVIIQPADRSAIVASSGPPQFVPAAQLASRSSSSQLLQSTSSKAVDEYKSAYPVQLKFDYSSRRTKRPSISSRSTTTTSSRTSRPMRPRSSACTR